MRFLLYHLHARNFTVRTIDAVLSEMDIFTISECIVMYQKYVTST